MGIITDEDAQEAEQDVELDFPFIKKDKKNQFLIGFVDAWKKSKKSNRNPSTELILRYLNEGIELNPENFGRAFGCLIGIIESYYAKPEDLLKQGNFEWVIRSVNTLKAKPEPHFYKMSMQRIDKLKNLIKLGELTQEQRESLGTLIANLK